MTPYLLSLIAAMFAAVDQQHRCLTDAKGVLPDAKDSTLESKVVLDDCGMPMPDPLDGFEPPKSPLPYTVQPATETDFFR